MCFGNTRVDQASASAVNGLPHAGTPTAPVRAHDPHGTNNDGFRFSNGSSGTRLKLDASEPMVSLDTSSAAIDAADQQLRHDGTPTNNVAYLTGTGFLDATATTAAACGTAQSNTIRLFPTTFAPNGVVQISLEQRHRVCAGSPAHRPLGHRRIPRHGVLRRIETTYTVAAWPAPTPPTPCATARRRLPRRSRWPRRASSSGTTSPRGSRWSQHRPDGRPPRPSPRRRACRARSRSSPSRPGRTSRPRPHRTRPIPSRRSRSRSAPSPARWGTTDERGRRRGTRSTAATPSSSCWSPWASSWC